MLIERNTRCGLHLVHLGFELETVPFLHDHVTTDELSGPEWYVYPDCYDQRDKVKQPEVYLRSGERTLASRSEFDCAIH